MKIKGSFILLLCLIHSIGVLAKVQLSPLFTDNMVLQRESEVPFWGKTAPGKPVKLITSWNNKEYVVRASIDSTWKVKIQTPQAGGPYSIVISDGDKVTLNNVLIGDVWICSGQSNMEMSVGSSGKVANYQQELAEAGYPQIRLLSVEKALSLVPLDDFKAKNRGWQVCSGKTLDDFSAVAYFFGRNIYQNQHIPVGLINTSWGGTVAETWTSEEALQTMPDFLELIKDLKKMPASKSEQEALYQERLVEWKEKIDVKDAGYAGNQATWANTNLNEKDWGKMQVPGFFQKQGLEGFNGIVWFRKTITIPETWEGKELTLNLGAIDDNDYTYFNGVEIGHTEGWMTPRIYKIPAGMVKKGKAVITVRVIDTGGDGGFAGGAGNLYFQVAGATQQSLAGEWSYRVGMDLKDIPSPPQSIAGNPNFPSLLFNAMLNPLIPFTIKGAIWYQGEANTGRAYQYNDLLPLMITDWRNHWGQEFPFYIVQLANFTSLQTKPIESTWAELREAQLKTALHLNNTGLAVTIDIGEADDIHPKNKQDVGIRLALAARANTYGEKISYSGPVYDSYIIDGHTIKISFKHTDGGLKTLNSEELKGFTIAGVNHEFHWANAEIKGNEVWVSCPEVSFPVAVRYAWADNPLCSLYNGAGLPASPFRTDDWQGITWGRK